MMSKLSLLDKLKVLGDVTSSSGLFIIAIIILIALAILLITTSTKTKKISKSICIIIYSAIIIISFLFYREELFELFDYMMNNFFIAIYFPNLAIYFAAVVITNIILWISVFNRKINKWIRTINTIMFCVIHYLLILIINIMVTNKLDIYDQTSIYQNQNAQAMIELSSTIFIVWILFLAIYKLIRIYQQNQEVELSEPKTRTVQESKPIIITETKEVKKLPDNIRKTQLPSIIYIDKASKKATQEQSSLIDYMTSSLPEKENTYLTDIPSPIPEERQFLDIMLSDEKIMKPQKSSKQPKDSLESSQLAKKEKSIHIIEQPKIVNKEKQNIKKQNEIENLSIFDNILTLEDYKRVLSILKSYQHQQTENKNNTRISIKDLQELYQRR